MASDKENEPQELRPRTRVRVETWRMLLRGMLESIRQGCVIHAVHVTPADPDAESRRSRRIGSDRRLGPLPKRPGKPGRPPKRKRRKGENNEEKVKRLARERQQRKRQRDKQKR